MLPVIHGDQFWPYRDSAPCIHDSLPYEKLPANPDILASPRRSPLLVKMRVYLLFASTVIFYTTLLLFLFFFSSHSFPISFATFLGTDTQIHSEWNVLYHLGGNGPWIPKVENVVEGGIDPPDGCEVDMVHMVRRNPIIVTCCC